MPPKAGTKYTYSGDKALGESHLSEEDAQRRADTPSPDAEDGGPGVLQVLGAEADLAPGTEVTVREYDRDRDLVVLEWTDAQGNPRATSVEPDHFTKRFKKD